MITTVFIDVDNTILDFNKSSEDSIKAAFEKENLKYDDYVFEVFRNVNNKLWKMIEDESLTIEELHKVRWTRIFEVLGIDKDGEAFEKHFLQGLKVGAAEVTGATDLLKYLSSKYNVYAASNSTYDQQYKRLKTAGMLKYIKELFVSEKIGFEKPQKAFFDACIERIGNVPRDEIIMIGDSVNADIKGARESGIKSCWYNYNHISPHDVPADYTVNALKDIKNIL